jgi:hypothetical protein
MSNHQRCCILAVCCAPFSPEREAALAEYLFEAMEQEEYHSDDERLRAACRVAAKKLLTDELIKTAI